MASQVERIKWVEGTSFLVDGFGFTSPKCSAYFLTHYHSDHYWGLRPSFSKGTIFCSEITGALLIGKLGIKPQFVHMLPMERPTTIEGVEVTLLDANHCPGAVMLVFHLKRANKTILHTGDFRASDGLRARMTAWLRARGRKIDTVYLDTTYCNHKYTFPSQASVLASLSLLARREKEAAPSTLFYVGTYSIGKERAVRAVAEGIGSKVYADKHKERTLRLAGEWDDGLYSSDARECSVRMAWLGRLRAEKMRAGGRKGGGRLKGQEELQQEQRKQQDRGRTEEKEEEGGREVLGREQDGERTDKEGEEEEGKEGREGGAKTSTLQQSLGMEGENEREEEEEEVGARRPVVGFRPTGWSFTRNKKKKGKDDFPSSFTSLPAPPSSYTPWINEEEGAKLYFVPYSEHSSYTELRAFIRAIRPRKIIPTVSAGDEKAVERQLKHFLPDMDLSQDRARLDSYFMGGERGGGREGGRVGGREGEGGARGRGRGMDLGEVDVKEQVQRWAELVGRDGKEEGGGREVEMKRTKEEKRMKRKAVVEVVLIDDDDD
ncbi:dna cross-link repair 1a protein [Nannochloropsis oceanica]